MRKLPLAITSLFCFFMYACSAQTNKDTINYSIGADFASNSYHFSNVPDVNSPLNSLIKLFSIDQKSYGSNGFGIMLSKPINKIAWIKISPSIYNIHNQQQFSYAESDMAGSTLKDQSFNMNGFSIPVSYVSYFKVPKRKISCYFMGTIEYHNYDLTTFDSSFQNNVLSSAAQNHYNQKGIGLLAGIGLNYKIIENLYLFYELEGGVALKDAAFFGDLHIGAHYNFFKSRHFAN
jgi:hypothetical protein